MCVRCGERGEGAMSMWVGLGACALCAVDKKHAAAPRLRVCKTSVWVNGAAACAPPRVR